WGQELVGFGFGEAGNVDRTDDGGSAGRENGRDLVAQGRLHRVLEHKVQWRRGGDAALPDDGGAIFDLHQSGAGRAEARRYFGQVLLHVGGAGRGAGGRRRIGLAIGAEPLGRSLADVIVFLLSG